MLNDSVDVILAKLLGASEEPSALRKFLHRFGSETYQGEVVLEFDGKFYRIRKYNQER